MGLAATMRDGLASLPTSLAEELRGELREVAKQHIQKSEEKHSPKRKIPNGAQGGRCVRHAQMWATRPEALGEVGRNHCGRLRREPSQWLLDAPAPARRVRPAHLPPCSRTTGTILP